MASMEFGGGFESCFDDSLIISHDCRHYQCSLDLFARRLCSGVYFGC